MVSVSGNERVLIDGVFYFDNSHAREERAQLKGWVFADIVRSVYRNLDHHTKEIYPKVNSYSFKKEMQVRDDVALVDVDHCYLQVAHNLGYIGDKDYKRIVKRYDDIKIDVCAAFTSLFKEIRCTYIGPSGKIDRVIECNNYELEIVRDNIINYSHKIMADWVGDYYIRNVDGIWIPLCELESLKGHLNGLGLKFKVISGKFLTDKLLWDNDKQKTIFL